MAQTRLGNDFEVVVGDYIMQHWFSGDGTPQEVAPRTWFVDAPFTNASAFETDEGLLLVDTGVEIDGPRIHRRLRELSDAPLHTVIYTHGHIDHAFGMRPWLEAGERPRIVAHRNVPGRFHRYMRTVELNKKINALQMQIDDMYWPSTPGEFFWPDTLYDDHLTLRIGGEVFELYHGKGETDDATWVWAPERKVLCTGDFWTWCAPNCGNPQKVQRYPEEWADAAEHMASLGAEVLLPGHGPAMHGTEEIRDALQSQAAYLRTIVEQTLEGLNAGLEHDEIVARLRIPGELLERPYLRPTYDRAEFVVRNVIRRYGGWWERYPSLLLPATMRVQSAEIVRLSGGPERLAERARELVDTDLVLACHLAEWATLGAPDSREAHECARDVFTARLEAEESLMGRAIFMYAIRQANEALERLAT